MACVFVLSILLLAGLHKYFTAARRWSIWKALAIGLGIVVLLDALFYASVLLFLPQY